jgi:hypothetical protein
LAVLINQTPRATKNAQKGSFEGIDFDANQPFGFAFTEILRRSAIFRTVAGGRFKSPAIVSKDFPEAASFIKWRSSA